MADMSLEEFADRLNSVMSVLAREFHKYQSKDFFNTKLTLPQFVMLESLSRMGEPRMTDLANNVNVTTAAVTGLVDRLVRDGYVERERDDKDRRIIKVRLTAKGTKTVNSIIDHRRRVMIRIFSVISNEERQRYLEILSHVSRHLKDEEAG